MPTAVQWKPIDDPTNRRARCHSCVNRVAGIFVCSLFISEWLTNRQRHRDETRLKKNNEKGGDPRAYTLFVHFAFSIEMGRFGERGCMWQKERLSGRVYYHHNGLALLPRPSHQVWWALVWILATNDTLMQTSMSVFLRGEFYVKTRQPFSEIWWFLMGSLYKLYFAALLQQDLLVTKDECDWESCCTLEFRSLW